MQESSVTVITPEAMVEGIEDQLKALTERMKALEDSLARAGGFRPLLCLHPEDRVFIPVAEEEAKRLFMMEVDRTREVVDSYLKYLEHFKELLKGEVVCGSESTPTSPQAVGG